MTISTSFIYPPIPNRNFDWSAVYGDYDGAEDSGNRNHIGFGATEADAVADLIENYSEASDLKGADSVPDAAASDSGSFCPIL